MRCKHCGHKIYPDNPMTVEDDIPENRNIPERDFDILNVCNCPCHWDISTRSKLLEIAKEYWEKK